VSPFGGAEGSPRRCAPMSIGAGEGKNPSPDMRASFTPSDSGYSPRRRVAVANRNPSPDSLPLFRSSQFKIYNLKFKIECVSPFGGAEGSPRRCAPMSIGLCPGLASGAGEDRSLTNQNPFPHCHSGMLLAGIHYRHPSPETLPLFQSFNLQFEIEN